MSDVAISAQLTSDGNIDGLSDLGRSMGGALSLALAAARLQGDDELAQLLEFAKITDNNGELSLDLALPEDYLRKHLNKACSEIINPPAPTYIDVEDSENEYDEYEDGEYDDEEDRGPLTADPDDEAAYPEDETTAEEVELSPERPRRFPF